MWWIVWTLLIIASLALTAWLCWRIFVALRELLRGLGEVTRLVGEAQAQAEKDHELWVEARATEDAEFAAALAERARPIRPGLGAPPTYNELNRPEV